MTRLASATLFDAPLLSLDEMLVRVERVTGTKWPSWPPSSTTPSVSRRPASGRDEDRFRDATLVSRRWPRRTTAQLASVPPA